MWKTTHLRGEGCRPGHFPDLKKTVFKMLFNSFLADQVFSTFSGEKKCCFSFSEFSTHTGPGLERDGFNKI